MLKDATGTKKMTWIHDEHIMNICGVNKNVTPKLMLMTAKFSVFLNDHQIVHVTVM